MSYKVIDTVFNGVSMPACYGPSINSVTVTKERPPGSGRLYGTSGTMGQGVAESHS